MKLLRKPEIVALKERERAREASEGLKLARKIDELRELQSSAEAKLNDFRTSSLRVMGEEIKNLVEKRDALAFEVSSLQSKLDSMLPGMGTKREELAAKEKNLKKQEAFLQKKEESASLYEIDVLGAKKDAEDARKRALTAETSALQLLHVAAEKEKNAQATLARAQSIESVVNRDKIAQDDFIGERNAYLAQRERELQAVSDRLAEDRLTLEREKIKLEDRKRMVDRTIERLKQQRINAEFTGQ